MKVNISKYRKKNSRDTVTPFEAWFLLIAGIIMGTVFVFGEMYWHAPVTKEECIHTTGIYSVHKIHRGRHSSVKEIIIRFEDIEQLSVGGECITSEVQNDIEELAAGTKVALTVHPNSDTIMEMRTSDKVILEFEETSEKIARETKGFFYLGLFMYGGAVMGAYYLITKKARW